MDKMPNIYLFTRFTISKNGTHVFRALTKVVAAAIPKVTEMSALELVQKLEIIRIPLILPFISVIQNQAIRAVNLMIIHISGEFKEGSFVFIGLKLFSNDELLLLSGKFYSLMMFNKPKSSEIIFC